MSIRPNGTSITWINAITPAPVDGTVAFFPLPNGSPYCFLCHLSDKYKNIYLFQNETDSNDDKIVFSWNNNVFCIIVFKKITNFVILNTLQSAE